MNIFQFQDSFSLRSRRASKLELGRYMKDIHNYILFLYNDFQKDLKSKYETFFKGM